MTTENISTPGGLYAISGLIFIGLIQIVYYILTTPSYLFFGIIFIPLFIYLGIGIIKRWKGARKILFTFLILLFLLTLFNLATGFFIEEVKQHITVEGTIQKVVRLLILPFIIYYLNTDRVKSYFKPVIFKAQRSEMKNLNS